MFVVVCCVIILQKIMHSNWPEGWRTSLLPLLIRAVGIFHPYFNLLQTTYQIQQIVITIYLQNIVRGRSKLKTFYILLFWEIIGPLIRIGIVDINSILCTKVLLIFCKCQIIFYKNESKNLFAPLKIWSFCHMTYKPFLG